MRKPFFISWMIVGAFCALSASSAEIPAFQGKNDQNEPTMTQNTKYAYYGKLLAKPGEGSNLANILLQAAELMKIAEGCHLYLVGHNPEDADEILITEFWDSKEAHDVSLGIPGVRELIGQAMPLLASPPQGGTEVTVLGGLGME